MKIWSAIAVATFAVAGLTACGGDSSAYCDDLKSFASDSESLDGEGAEALDKIKDIINKLEKDAPNDVKDEWKTVKAVFDGGLADGGDEALSPEDVEKATTKISDHAKDTCDVDLDSLG